MDGATLLLIIAFLVLPAAVFLALLCSLSGLLLWGDCWDDGLASLDSAVSSYLSLQLRFGCRQEREEKTARQTHSRCLNRAVTSLAVGLTDQQLDARPLRTSVKYIVQQAGCET